MKLAVTINAFCGLELLKYSLPEIRDQVDFILLNYQMTSYFGNPIKPEDLSEIYRLKKIGLIDYMHNFKSTIASNSYEAKLIETQKRNEAKDICYNKGFSFFIDMDVDEFYKKEEFKKAKQFIIDNNIDYSACHFVNYQNRPTIQSKEIAKSIVPFICKLDDLHRLGGAVFLGPCDPTRGYNISSEDNLKTHVFTPQKLLMHHMTGVRNDLYAKYDNTSLSNLDKKRITELVHSIKSLNRKKLIMKDDFKNIDKDYRIVHNYFKIKLISLLLFLINYIFIKYEFIEGFLI